MRSILLALSFFVLCLETVQARQISAYGVEMDIVLVDRAQGSDIEPGADISNLFDNDPATVWAWPTNGRTPLDMRIRFPGHAALEGLGIRFADSAISTRPRDHSFFASLSLDRKKVETDFLSYIEPYLRLLTEKVSTEPYRDSNGYMWHYGCFVTSDVLNTSYQVLFFSDVDNIEHLNIRGALFELGSGPLLVSELPLFFEPAPGTDRYGALSGIHSLIADLRMGNFKSIAFERRSAFQDLRRTRYRSYEKKKGLGHQVINANKKFDRRGWELVGSFSRVEKEYAEPARRDDAYARFLKYKRLTLFDQFLPVFVHADGHLDVLGGVTDKSKDDNVNLYGVGGETSYYALYAHLEVSRSGVVTKAEEIVGGVDEQHECYPVGIFFQDQDLTKVYQPPGE